jgi:hypothetical protein
MKHLTVDEMIDFVSFETVDPKTLANASKVTTHIRGCSQCLRRVQAFQMVYDELKLQGEQSALPRLAQAILDDASAPRVMKLPQAAAGEIEIEI